MQKKRVFVLDSFNTKEIASILKDVYAEKATVYHGDTLAILSHMDLYFLSAKMILDGEIEIWSIKTDHPNAKIVAMSVAPVFFQTIKNRRYPVDFFHNKEHLVAGNGPVIKLPQAEIDLLNSYL